MDPMEAQRDKSCWYPFKAAITQRKVGPTSGYWRKRTQMFHVDMYEYAETASQHLGATELVLQGHPIPANHVSLAIARTGEKSNAQLAPIELRRALECWAEKESEGGAQPCSEDPPQIEQQPSQIQGSSASFPWVATVRQARRTKALDSTSTMGRRNFQTASIYLPKVEVMHQPRRAQSNVSSLKAGNQKFQMLRDICMRANGRLSPPVENSSFKQISHEMGADDYSSNAITGKHKLKMIQIPVEETDDESSDTISDMDALSSNFNGIPREILIPLARSGTAQSLRTTESRLCGAQCFGANVNVD